MQRGTLGVIVRATLLSLTASMLLFVNRAGHGQVPGMEALADMPAGFEAARESSWDATGANQDCLTNIRPGETVVVADLAGPAMITHLWFTVAAEPWHGRKIVLRIFWDNEPQPSVLTPLNDFFCMGHGIESPMWSIPICTTGVGAGRNCFFRMPFNKRARIEIANEGLEPVAALYYQVDYRKYRRPLEGKGCFHAHYRQEYPCAKGRDYRVCDARGRGVYVGTVLSVERTTKGWWGEGDDRIYVDGDTSPTLHGTGLEDYFGGAWGFTRGNSPYLGTSILFDDPPDHALQTSFRFHVEDPIPFGKSIRIEFEHRGVGKESGKWRGFAERPDNYSSVAYWYQAEPHATLGGLPPVEDRLPVSARDHAALLRFLRAADAAPGGAMSAKTLETSASRLLRTDSLEAYAADIRMRMAEVAARAGDMKRARAIVARHVQPFVDQHVIERGGRIDGLLDDATLSRTVRLVPWSDGSVTRANRCGRPCVRTLSGTPPRNYCYFALPEDSPEKHIGGDVEMRIGYYSSGLEGDTFRVQYDSLVSDDFAGRYLDSRLVRKSTEPGWHTARVLCPRARFSGRQNGGADFRISNCTDGDEFIGRIEVVPGRPRQKEK